MVLQVVEYFRAFLVGRVAWSKMNALLIISGAFGLFKRSLVVAAGGYATATVGEDVELVVRFHRTLRDRRRRYRIVFVPDPVCWTEAPEDLKTLATQRRRWQRGLVETLVTHRAAIGNPRAGAFGLVALPYFVVFEAVGPLIELFGYLLIPTAWAMGVLGTSYMMAFFLLAVATGTLLSVSALALEELSFHRHRSNREVLRLAMYAVIDNIGYRQLTNLWRVIGIIDFLRGKQGWGEMHRRGLDRSTTREETLDARRDRLGATKTRRANAQAGPQAEQRPKTAGALFGGD